MLGRLVDQGNTVLVIEHNLDVIKTADWLIDMGPEGGSRGGMVVAEGTPEQVADDPDSYTGAFLKPLLEGREAEQPTRKASPQKAPADQGDGQEAAGQEGDRRRRPPAKEPAERKAPATKAAAKKVSLEAPRTALSHEPLMSAK